jgi:hypothetical protein
MCLLLLSGVTKIEMRATDFSHTRLPNPSSRTMALGSTQPLTEMSTRTLPGGKRAAGAEGLQPYRRR